MSEWDAVKEGLRRIETEPDKPIKGAIPSYQMMVNARFAHALRLIMERLDE